MAFALTPLPYADTALEPAISAHTLSFHHAKHHQAYVDKMNAAIDGTELDGKPMSDVRCNCRSTWQQSGPVQQCRAKLDSRFLLAFT